MLLKKEEEKKEEFYSGQMNGFFYFFLLGLNERMFLLYSFTWKNPDRLHTYTLLHSENVVATHFFPDDSSGDAYNPIRAAIPLPPLSNPAEMLRRVFVYKHFKPL